MNTMDPKLEKIYDSYSPILFGIALDMASTREIAEDILANTFQRISKYQLTQQNNSTSFCITLIKLLILTAHNSFIPSQLKNNFKLKPFQKTPILHTLLCEQMTLENYCQLNKIAFPHVAKQIRSEFATIRNWG